MEYYNVQLSKYNTDSQHGMVDNLKKLDLSDDVAHVKWGGGWRMPTKTEMDELVKKCTWNWTSLNGVKGFRITSNVTGYTNCSIFLPAAGTHGGLHPAGSDCLYWTSSLMTSYPVFAERLHVTQHNRLGGDEGRFYGQSVRPVCL